MPRHWLAWVVPAVAALASCTRSHQHLTDAVPNSSPEQRSAAPSARAPVGGAASAAKRPAPPPLSMREFGRLFRSLSEPDRSFFSDNFVSNETSYLQVARALSRRATPNQAYIGVGPEQNFTYIALTRPRLAFIVDIRRENALLQLLYKAVFDAARSRTEFLSLLLGRVYDRAADPGGSAGAERVIRATLAEELDPSSFSRRAAALRSRIVQSYAIRLSAKDVSTLQHIQRVFFDHQLALHFELKQPNGRHYPSLEALLTERAPKGGRRGFLATREEFSIVRSLERDNRVIPVVGDFAGQHALAGIATELRRRHLRVSVFYVSNVEQYLFHPPAWQDWVKNVQALPRDAQSLFVRCYLDQGRRHPLQMPGHRTTTVLGFIDHFVTAQHAHGYENFWQVATDDNL